MIAVWPLRRDQLEICGVKSRRGGGAKEPVWRQRAFPLQGTLALLGLFHMRLYASLSIFGVSRRLMILNRQLAVFFVYPRVAGGCDEVHERQSKQLWTSRGRAVDEPSLKTCCSTMALWFVLAGFIQIVLNCRIWSAAPTCTAEERRSTSCLGAHVSDLQQSILPPSARGIRLPQNLLPKL